MNHGGTEARRCVVFLFVTLCLCGSLRAQNPDTLFQSHCAQCHSTNNNVGAPLPEALRQMSWQTILAAIETGKMKSIGDALSATERDAIAKYLGTSPTPPMPPSAKCSAASQSRGNGSWS